MAVEQIELFPLPNPCINVCEAGPRGYCTGCLRSREERFNWLKKSDAEKAHILKLLSHRQRRKAAFWANVAREEQAEFSFNNQLSLPGFNSKT